VGEEVRAEKVYLFVCGKSSALLAENHMNLTGAYQSVPVFFCNKPVKFF